MSRYAIVIGILAVLILGGSSVWSGPAEAGQGGEFLRYGSSVRSLALGRAYVAMVDDPSALYYNPAGLLRQARQWDGYSFLWLSSFPFNEGQYNYVAVAEARPDADAKGLLKELVGPATAWGVALVDMRDDDYEYRDADDHLLPETFGLYQQAFLLGFAREFSGSWGHLGSGLTMKVVRQGVTGAADLASSDQAMGLDLGLQFQPLSPPLFRKLIPLKDIMPLRLGFAVSNLIAPKVGFGGEKDQYPTVARLGFSYALQERGLIWSKLHTNVNIVGDVEWFWRGRRTAGKFLGLEPHWQYDNVRLAIRGGVNHVSSTTRLTAGFGLQIDLKSATVSLEFAHGTHDRLPDDQRIALRISFGARRDGAYFRPDNIPAMAADDAYLHTVTHYPYERRYVDTAAGWLADSLDTENARRYRQLLYDVKFGDLVYEESWHLFQDSVVCKAETKSREAIEIYAAQPEGKLGDTARLNQAQAYVILDSLERAADAATKAKSESLRRSYLIGLSSERQDKWTSATVAYRAAGGTRQDVAGMRLLALLGLGRCHLENGDPTMATNVLKELVEDYSAPLPENYPRFERFNDRDLADDAQLLIGRAQTMGADAARSAAEMAKLLRYYPRSDQARSAKVRKEIEAAVQTAAKE